MLEAGEDPLYIARRLIRFASEDVGNADPQALTVAVAAKDAVAFHRHARGQHRARAGGHLPGDGAEEQRRLHAPTALPRPTRTRRRAEPVPLHLRNAPTKLMKQLEYGKGYQYAHDDRDAVTDMDCLPPSLAGQDVLRADRSRIREGDQTTARGVGEDQAAASRRIKVNIGTLSGECLLRNQPQAFVRPRRG